MYLHYIDTLFFAIYVLTADTQESAIIDLGAEECMRQYIDLYKIHNYKCSRAFHTYIPHNNCSVLLGARIADRMTQG